MYWEKLRLHPHSPFGYPWCLWDDHLSSLAVACEVHALKKWQRNELEVGEKISRPHGMRTYMPSKDIEVILGHTGHP